MSYVREGAAKISDHQVASPMRTEETINQSCLTCHHSTATEMKERVANIHEGWEGAKDVAFTAVQALIDDLTVAVEKGTATEAQLAKAYDYQRKSQYLADYSISENSRGFHAPAYSITMLNQATDYARSGQLALRGVDVENARGPQSYSIAPGRTPEGELTLVSESSKPGAPEGVDAAQLREFLASAPQELRSWADEHLASLEREAGQRPAPSDEVGLEAFPEFSDDAAAAGPRQPERQGPDRVGQGSGVLR